MLCCLDSSNEETFHFIEIFIFEDFFFLYVSQSADVMMLGMQTHNGKNTGVGTTKPHVSHRAAASHRIIPALIDELSEDKEANGRHILRPPSPVC